MLLCSNSNKINNNWPIKQEDDRFRPSSIMSVSTLLKCQDYFLAHQRGVIVFSLLIPIKDKARSYSAGLAFLKELG